jgi:hypothetical protein
MMSTINVRNTITKLTYDWFNEVISGTEYDLALAELMGQNYPNPATEYTIIPLGDIKKNMKIHISDIFGHLVMNLDVLAGERSVKVNTSELVPRIYQCTLLDGIKEIAVRRVVIVR